MPPLACRLPRLVRLPEPDRSIRQYLPQNPSKQGSRKSDSAISRLLTEPSRTTRLSPSLQRDPVLCWRWMPPLACRLPRLVRLPWPDRSIRQYLPQNPAKQGSRKSDSAISRLLTEPSRTTRLSPSLQRDPVL